MNYARLPWQLYRKKQTMKKTQEQIQTLREKKLRKMLLYAYDNSAYYREAFEAAGITAERIGTTPLDHFPKVDPSKTNVICRQTKPMSVRKCE